jgi:hypothetical protein
VVYADIDSRVSQVISLRFGSESFWTRGKFPTTITNSTTGDVIKLTNPWAQSTNNVAPFDQGERGEAPIRLTWFGLVDFHFT